MQELHGVIMRTPDALQFEVKHKLLLFDHLHIIGLAKFIEDLEASDDPISQGLGADLSFLASHNMIEPVTNETVNNGIDHGKLLKCPDNMVRPKRTLADKWDEMSQDQFSAYLALHETKELLNSLVMDTLVRCVAVEIGLKRKAAVVPICHFEYLDHLLNSPISNTSVLRVALESLPVPGEESAIQDILDFKAELHGKQWTFRRFLRDLAIKNRSVDDLRDDFEATRNDYCEAMKRHKLSIRNKAATALIIPAMSVLNNHSLFVGSAIVGALAIRQLHIELVEGEAKAAGRECAYLLDAEKRFKS
jgi:hypothetical protein